MTLFQAQHMQQRMDITRQTSRQTRTKTRLLSSFIAIVISSYGFCFSASAQISVGSIDFGEISSATPFPDVSQVAQIPIIENIEALEEFLITNHDNTDLSRLQTAIKTEIDNAGVTIIDDSGQTTEDPAIRLHMGGMAAAIPETLTRSPSPELTNQIISSANERIAAVNQTKEKAPKHDFEFGLLLGHTNNPLKIGVTEGLNNPYAGGKLLVNLNKPIKDSNPDDAKASAFTLSLGSTNIGFLNDGPDLEIGTTTVAYSKFFNACWNMQLGGSLEHMTFDAYSTRLKTEKILYIQGEKIFNRDCNAKPERDPLSFAKVRIARHESNPNAFERNKFFAEFSHTFRFKDEFKGFIGTTFFTFNPYISHETYTDAKHEDWVIGAKLVATRLLPSEVKLSFIADFGQLNSTIESRKTSYLDLPIYLRVKRKF